VETNEATTERETRHRAWCEKPEAPSGAGKCPGCGVFLPQNSEAQTHGLRAFEQRGESALPAELRDELAAFQDGVEADQGGASELSTIGAGYTRRLTEVEAIVRLLGADLQARGIFTAKGRVRSSYNAFLLALDRWDRIAQRLGLERKSRPVNPLDAVASAVAKANQR
jgi:hypothetical protein